MKFFIYGTIIFLLIVTKIYHNLGKPYGFIMLIYASKNQQLMRHRVVGNPVYGCGKNARLGARSTRLVIVPKVDICPNILRTE